VFCINPQYSGGKRKSLDTYRRLSSLTSIDDILNTYDSTAEEDVDTNTSFIAPSFSVD
jgi:hypothetical protein